MKEQNILYQIKDLNNSIGMFLIKNNTICKEISPPTPTQIRIIHYILSHNQESIYQRDIEKELNLTRATLSGVLKTMEKNDILKRMVNTTDARSKQIILNEKYKELFLKNKTKLNKIEKNIIKDIKHEEIDIFLKVLNKMKENVSKEGNDLHDKII